MQENNIPMYGRTAVRPYTNILAKGDFIQLQIPN